MLTGSDREGGGGVTGSLNVRATRPEFISRDQYCTTGPICMAGIDQGEGGEEGGEGGSYEVRVGGVGW